MLDNSDGSCHLHDKPDVVSELSATSLVCLCGGTTPLTSKFGHGGSRINSGGARPGSGRPRKIITELPLDDIVRTYCIRTKYESERLAADGLRAAGFEVFSPSIWKPPAPPKRDVNGIMRQGRPARVEALFKRYAFVDFNRADTDWYGIRDIEGVERVICSMPGCPVAVPEAAIAWVKAQLSSNWCLYPHKMMTRAVPIAVGTTIRLKSGALVDRTGLIQASDGERVKVLMSIMGHDVIVSADQEDVEPIEPTL